MLLYRAINDLDEANCNIGYGIKAKKMGSKEESLRTAASHIAMGSKENFNSCWISTSKCFKICAKEFSIPQMGGYNNAIKRKKIAVIDRKDIVNPASGYVFNGNFTFIKDKSGLKTFDLGNDSDWPANMQLNQVVNKKLVENHVAKLKEHLDNLVDLETFILDMTFPSHSDRGSKYAPLNKFSFYDYYKNGIISSGKGMPIISGLVKRKSLEVLILNEIPQISIKRNLSLIEIDVLYALFDNNFDDVLFKIINNNIKIDVEGHNIIINGDYLNLNNEEQSLIDDIYNKNISIIDLVYAAYKEKNFASVFNILDIFNDLKKLKRNFISKVINCMLLTEFNNVNILEDEIIVAIKGNNSLLQDSILKDLPTKNKYDLLLVGDATSGEIFKFSDKNYRKEWKKFTGGDCIYIIKDNNGNKLFCHLKS